MIPASYAQQRLWFSERAADAPGLYNLPFALRLKGKLDRAALRQAVTDVVERHEALRTVFTETDGRIEQRILELAAHPVPFHEHPATADPAGLPGEPFDLAGEIPIRAHLLGGAADEHTLLLVMHHIAVDGWSLRPLLADLQLAYRARSTGLAPEFEPLPVQYADYTLWQHELLGELADPASLLARQLDYWAQNLAGLPDECTVPTDRPRPTVPSHRGAGVSVSTGPDLHRQLTELARAHGATLFMVIQAGLAALMSRLGAGTDIVIGTATSGRTDEALDDLVGFFINTLVLRTDLSGNPTVVELLNQVRARDLDGFAHADVPFERVVEQLNPARTLARHPLFQVMLLVQNQAQAAVEQDAGLAMMVAPAGTDSVKLDLSISATEEPAAGLRLNADFAHDLFDRDSVRTLLDRLVRVLSQLAAEPSARMSDLAITTPDERLELLRPAGPAPAAPLVLPEFDRQVALRPDAAAVADRAGELTYAQLADQAARLAGYLHEAGVRRGQVVGLHLPRGRELVIAELAVLRIGCAYLPLDPTYPSERLEQICVDCQAPVVLSLSELAGRFRPSWAVLVELDTLADRLPLAAGIEAEVTDRDAAYVIYTSGSTGSPKGVVIEHRNLAAVCAATRKQELLGPDDRKAMVANPGFDASVIEIWPVLTSGGCVAVPDPAELADDEFFVRWLRQARVTVTFMPTARVPELLPALAADPGALKFAYTGGDRLGRAFEHELPFRFANQYGPTETTVLVTSAEVRFDRLAAAELPTIGVPLPGVRSLVLDDFLQPVPVGVRGELYLTGAHTGRGYLARPGLTASRYVASPFGDGERMYRTGDLVSRRADGELAFVGRVDGQVKLRGLRIELGEIEAVLGSHPQVAQAVVTLHERRPGDRALHAFVRADGATGDLLAELRAFASRLLPEYMLPAGIEVVESFPVTPNGKVDRARLRPSLAAVLAEFRAPQDELQTALCEIFSDVLDAEKVGIDDNFFDLGGHSLLATRLTSRIRQRLDTPLGIRDIFECPSVAALADRLQAGHLSATGVPASLPGAPGVLVPLRATGSRTPLFCIHPAAGLSWVYAPLVRLVDAEQPVFGVQSPALFDAGELPGSVREMAARYLAAIRRQQPIGPYQLLGWSYGAGVAHEIAAQLEEAGERVSLLVMLDGYPPDLAPHPVLAPADSENLSMLLGSLGQPVPAGRLDLAGYHELARLPGSPLAGLEDELVAALPAVFARNVNVLSEFRPRTVRADVLYFDAVADKTDQSPVPTEWLPYLAGNFEVIPLDCGHAGVLDPQPLARIGAVLRPMLDPDRTSARPLPPPSPEQPYRRPAQKMRKSS